MGVAELADALRLERSGRKVVGDRGPPPTPDFGDVMIYFLMILCLLASWGSTGYVIYVLVTEGQSLWLILGVVPVLSLFAGAFLNRIQMRIGG